MIPDVNVFGLRVELAKFGVSKGKHRLIIVIDDDGVLKWCKKF